MAMPDVVFIGVKSRGERLPAVLVILVFFRGWFNCVIAVQNSSKFFSCQFASLVKKFTRMGEVGAAFPTDL
jgi:hypothetical protein